MTIIIIKELFLVDGTTMHYDEQYTQKLAYCARIKARKNINSKK